MSHPDTAPISRRSLIALGAALVLPSGCAVTFPSLREVNLDAIGPDEVLLLGRIRLTIHELDYTGDAFVLATGSDEEVLLPQDGSVVWVRPRPPGIDLRLVRLTSHHGTLRLAAQGPVLAPHAVRTAINYFGTVHVTLIRAPDQDRDSGRVGKMQIDVADDQRVAMAAFVAQNPRLAGRVYYDVPQGAVLEAPVPPR